MRGKNLYNLIFIIILFLTAALFTMPLPASGGKKGEIKLIFSGNLGEFFHPLGNNPEQKQRISKLNEIMDELDEEHPEAIKLDTGNFVSIDDYSETLYKVPAIQHFRKYGYDVANIGSTEALAGSSMHLFNHDKKKNEPDLVSAHPVNNRRKSVHKFIDLSSEDFARIRISGIHNHDFSLSAPELHKKYHNADVNSILDDIYGNLDETDLGILLSELPREKNKQIAAALPGIDVILESEPDEESPSIEFENTVIVSRSIMESVGYVKIEKTPGESVKEKKYKSFEIKKKKGLFSLFKTEPFSETSPPPPKIGEMFSSDRMLDDIPTEYDRYELRRVNARDFQNQLEDKQVYYYHLMKDFHHIADTFYVKHDLGGRRPYYIFILTVDPERRLQNIRFLMTPLIAGKEFNIEEFTESIQGKKWDEITLPESGFAGAEEEIRMLFRDIQITLEIADKLL